MLDRWSEWKAMRAAPSRIDALEARLAKLEIAPKAAPGRPCPACGEPAMRRTATKRDPIFGDMGGKRDTWTCGACAATDEVLNQG
jgi:hypothetical protein